MKLSSAQEVIVESAKARAIIGLKLDLIELAKAKKDWKTIKEIRETLVGYRNFALHLMGEKGLGKTEGVSAAATMAKMPCLMLYPSQWVDSADAVGMPRVKIHNGREVTMNIIRDFFPQPKLDEKGQYMVRKDGGIMYDYEAVAEYISNYEDMLVEYEGDVNQAPGLVVGWDEFNRITAQDVQALMFNVILQQKLGDYKFPNGTFMVGMSNPNTSDYNVSSFLEDEAIKDRFSHITIEGDIRGFNSFAVRNKLHWSVVDLANANEGTVIPTGEAYEFKISSSGRSMHALSSLLNFTNLHAVLDESDFMELVHGTIGEGYAAAHAEILRNGLTRIPSGEEIITNYEEFREKVTGFIKNNNQDAQNAMKEKFLATITLPDAIEKYDLKSTMDGKEVIVTPNLENIYMFFQDITPEFRMVIVKELINHEKIHTAISMHTELYELMLVDISNSNSRK